MSYPTGTGLIGGIDATWFDTASDPELGLPCLNIGLADPESRCQLWTSTPGINWFQVSNVVSRNFYLESEDLLVTIAPWPGHTAADVIERLQPLLDGLTIMPRS